MSNIVIYLYIKWDRSFPKPWHCKSKFSKRNQMGEMGYWLQAYMDALDIKTRQLM